MAPKKNDKKDKKDAEKASSSSGYAEIDDEQLAQMLQALELEVSEKSSELKKVKTEVASRESANSKAINKEKRDAKQKKEQEQAKKWRNGFITIVIRRGGNVVGQVRVRRNSRCGALREAISLFLDLKKDTKLLMNHRGTVLSKHPCKTLYKMGVDDQSQVDIKTPQELEDEASNASGNVAEDNIDIEAITDNEEDSDDEDSDQMPVDDGEYYHKSK